MEENRPSYKLEVFEGPLDLLLSLIAKNQIDIYDIPIAEIFEQYTAYIEEMKRLDMDIASEFLVMASELMLIKSRLLLPKEVVDGVEVDPREELVQTLLEYRRAKEEAVFLADRYRIYFGRYTKETDEVGVDKTFVSEQESAFLTEALARILRRIRLDESMHNEDASRTLNSILNDRPATVSERTVAVITSLRKTRVARFMDLMLECRTKSEVIASFMAILSLISRQRIVADYDDGDPTDPRIRLIDDSMLEEEEEATEEKDEV